METKTYLAHSVDNTVNESQYDDCAKTLASDKDVLSRILKHVLTEYQDYDVETIKKCIEGEPEVTDQENELLRMLTILFSHQLSAEEKRSICRMITEWK